jgi:hypothetical protein
MCCRTSIWSRLITWRKIKMNTVIKATVIRKCMNQLIASTSSVNRLDWPTSRKSKSKCNKLMFSHQRRQLLVKISRRKKIKMKNRAQEMFLPQKIEEPQQGNIKTQPLNCQIDQRTLMLSLLLKTWIYQRTSRYYSMMSLSSLNVSPFIIPQLKAWETISKLKNLMCKSIYWRELRSSSFKR